MTGGRQISVKIDLIRLNKIKFNKSIESAHSLNSADDRLVGVHGKDSFPKWPHSSNMYYYMGD